jgi:cell division cycle 2-like
MDFIEHDLKTLMEDMREPFLQSEVKTLMLQLLSATALMHESWIIHRDLKTSNLLMTNRGMIKIADFGLARYFGEPVYNMTQLVVTLWYRYGYCHYISKCRAPELLLGTKEYGTEIDMWSIGCIFGELCLMEPLLQGKSEIEQLAKV